MTKNKSNDSIQIFKLFKACPMRTHNSIAAREKDMVNNETETYI